MLSLCHHGPRKVVNKICIKNLALASVFSGFEFSSYQLNDHKELVLIWPILSTFHRNRPIVDFSLIFNTFYLDGTQNNKLQQNMNIRFSYLYNIIVNFYIYIK